MILDLDVELQVALRALEEVVAPALGTAEKHVIEQLHLAIMTIGFVKQRLPAARGYARMELAELAALGEAIVAQLPDQPLADAAMQARAMLADPAADTDALTLQARCLRELTSAASGNAPDQASANAIDRLVLDHCGRILGQARQWTVPFGFELHPEQLPAPAW